jgi:NhaA family Na+:H+ antiporter
VAFVILPLFALANTGIMLGADWYHNLAEAGSIGIFLGLVVGKPLGIVLFSMAGVWLGLCSLPGDLKWKHIIGTGLLGGIGFTMSIFIALQAYLNSGLIDNAKIAVLISSAVSGIGGYFWLRRTLPNDGLHQNMPAINSSHDSPVK